MLLFNPVELLEVALEDDETEEVDPDLGMVEAPGEVLLGLGVEDLPLDLIVGVDQALLWMMESHRGDVAAQPPDVVQLGLAGPLVLHPGDLVDHRGPLPQEVLEVLVRHEGDLDGGHVVPGLLLIGVLQHLPAQNVGRQQPSRAGEVTLAQSVDQSCPLQLPLFTP